jgi:NDP-sugar pyrophosphorylase family protein
MSWKQYGGTNNFERASRINTQSLTANQIIFKEAYNGNFDICGGFQVSENASISGNLTVSGGTILNNDVTIGQSSSVLDVNAETNFNNNITLNAGFSTKGSIYAEEKAYIGNTIVYGNDNIIKQFIYGDLNGIGINTFNPQAAFDISTNQLYSILVKSSEVSNQSVLAQNVLKQGITIGVDSSSSFIYFNNDRQVLFILLAQILYICMYVFNNCLYNFLSIYPSMIII